MKTCSTCGVLKPLSEFHRHRGHKDGRASSCKVCRNVEMKNRYLLRIGAEEAISDVFKQRFAAVEARKNGVVPLSKTCSYCREEKPLDAFHKRRRSKLDGRGSVCKDCACRSTQAWYKANKERAAARRSTYAKENAERLGAARDVWLAQNVERVRGIKARYRERHPEKDRTNTAQRRASRLRAVTLWDADLDALVLSEAHALAKAREKATGLAWHVDHIVPLRGKHVCGLHNAYNVQVIPAVANLRKSNRHEP